MRVRLIVMLGSIVSVASLLTSCVIVQPRLAKDMPRWGNHKCVSVSPVGEHFTGWSVHRSEAREHALAICREATKEPGCRIESCRNDVVEEHTVVVVHDHHERHHKHKEKSHHSKKHR